MKTFSRFFAAALFVIFCFSSSIAQNMEKHDMSEKSGHKMFKPSDLKWTAGPASLPAGATIAVLEGDPTKEGPFTMRVKFPADYNIAPHFHPGVEHVTVISGGFFMGFGDVADKSKATEIPAGGFAYMEIGTHHFAFTKNETEVQVHGMGPWGITYINPADDPRSQLGTK